MNVNLRSCAPTSTHCRLSRRTLFAVSTCCFDALFRARAMGHFTDLLRDGGLLVDGVDWHSRWNAATSHVASRTDGSMPASSHSASTT
jgi:hypothetical protein